MIIGHKTAIRDLKKLADGENLSHSYIFWGPAMVGKRAVAEALANYLETGSFDKPQLLQDFLRIAPDEKNSIGIDQVRQIKNFLWQKPALSSRRTLVLDDAERMTAEAQNALLKITEEPPASSLLVLVASDVDALIPTVVSRFQKLYFSPVPKREFLAWATKEFGDTKKVADAVSVSAGRPGLLHMFLSGEGFAESIEAAQKLFRLSMDKRRELLKRMMERDGFDFEKLLDALILISSWEFTEASINKKNNSNAQTPAIRHLQFAGWWHALMRLRYESAYFNLNPRLQLESLFQGRGSMRT